MSIKITTSFETPQDLREWAQYSSWSCDEVVNRIERHNLWQNVFDAIEAGDIGGDGTFESETALNDLFRFGLDDFLDEIEPKDDDDAYEMCPFCERESKIDPDLFEPQPCEHCGKMILPCSECETRNCTNCPLESLLQKYKMEVSQ